MIHLQWDAETSGERIPKQRKIAVLTKKCFLFSSLSAFYTSVRGPEWVHMIHLPNRFLPPLSSIPAFMVLKNYFHRSSGRWLNHQLYKVGQCLQSSCHNMTLIHGHRICQCWRCVGHIVDTPAGPLKGRRVTRGEYSQHEKQGRFEERQASRYVAPHAPSMLLIGTQANKPGVRKATKSQRNFAIGEGTRTASPYVRNSNATFVQIHPCRELS